MKTEGRFDVDGPCKPGMKYKPDWSQGKKAAYNEARTRYHCTGAKEAPADKVSDMKKIFRRWKVINVNEDKIADLKASVASGAAKRDEA